MVRFKIRDQGISTRAARQIRMGIVTGEVIYNLVVKGERDAARRALHKASKTPKRVYVAALHTIENRMACNRDQVVV